MWPCAVQCTPHGHRSHTKDERWIGTAPTTQHLRRSGFFAWFQSQVTPTIRRTTAPIEAHERMPRIPEKELIYGSPPRSTAMSKDIFGQQPRTKMDKKYWKLKEEKINYSSYCCSEISILTNCCHHRNWRRFYIIANVEKPSVLNEFPYVCIT